MIPEAPGADPFHRAAKAYLVYGIVYWIGGAYLALHGIGTRSGSATVWEGVAWVAIGLVLVILGPFLLHERRRWFERWILSRRDFARILAVLMLARAVAVGRVAMRPDGASVPAPWGGTISFQAGAAVFFAVTVIALVFVALAAWRSER
jgi:hypothetical protein